MRFALGDFEGKGQHLYGALRRAGHEAVTTLEAADVLLLDHDWPRPPTQPGLIQAARDAGAKVALYPHGGLPTAFVYDGIDAASPLVDLRLEHGPGSLEIAELAGLDGLRQEAVGWLYSETRPFRRVKKPRRILFAPLHPNIEALLNGSFGNGHDPAPALNQRVYKRLLELGLEVTVSVVAPPYRNGLFAHPRVRFVQNDAMTFQAGHALLEAADVVVATGTLAAAAVAAGKPTVMFGQDDFSDYVGGHYVRAAHWERYAELCRYPYDADDGDLADQIREASKTEAVEWRERFVGDDGAERAVRVLERLVGEPEHVFIEGVTATAGAAMGGE